VGSIWARLAPAALALVFAWAGFSKVIRPGAWREELLRYQLAVPLKGMAMFILPWTEIGLAGALTLGPTGPPAWAILGLLGAFSAAIVRARVVQGTDKLTCGCFGAPKARDYRVLLLRNAMLAALAALVIRGAISTLDGGTAFPALRALQVPVLAGLTLTSVAWIGWQLEAYRRRGGTLPWRSSLGATDRPSARADGK
jgi:hypothetical protein